MKRHAKRLSEAGFRVLIPDIYKGKVGVDKEEASHLMGALDFGVAVTEICAAAAHLKTEGSAKVGVTGFCMGGALSLLSAAKCEGISCAAPFYGVPRDEHVDLSKMMKPVAGFFGERDASKGFSDPETAKALAAKLSGREGVEGEVKIYSGVGHGFMNDTPEPFKSFEEREAAMGHNYNVGVAEEAWARLIDFLKRQLA